MSTATNKLTQMVKDVPTQVAAATSGLGAIQSQIDNLSAQKAAITSVTNITTSGVTSDLQAVMVAQGGDNIVFGGNYGSVSQDGNLTDWVIRSGLTPVYTYIPGDYPDIDQFAGDFSFSADYLTKPFPSIDDIGTGLAATYGINAQLGLLNQGKSIMGNNLSKLEGSADVFNRYAT